MGKQVNPSWRVQGHTTCDTKQKEKEKKKRDTLAPGNRRKSDTRFGTRHIPFDKNLRTGDDKSLEEDCRLSERGAPAVGDYRVIR